MTTELEALRQKVAEAVARMDAATPGPWYAIGGEAGWVVTLSLNNPIVRLKNWLKPNAEFIAAHPTDIETMQELLSKVEALEVMRAESEHKLNELVMCVAQKHPGESRFDTAKRLILRAEESYDGKGKQNDTR